MKLVRGGGNGCGDAGRCRRSRRDGAGADDGFSRRAGSALRRRPCRAGAQTPATPAAQGSATPAPAAPQGGTIKGTVKAGAVPLPGVAVTATNTLTGKKYATTTDIDGDYQMEVPRNGRYVVKTELTGLLP